MESGASASLNEELDEDLLVFSSLDSNEGREAWGVFYRRHIAFVYTHLVRRWGRLVDPSELEDVTHETFLRARKYASSYSPASGNQADGRRRVRAWLGRIAENQVRGRLGCEEQLTEDQVVSSIWSPPRNADANPDSRLAAVVRALAELSETEQDVLRTTMQYSAAGEQSRLPNSVSRELATRLGTTPTNVRQIRRRALEKLRCRVGDILTGGAG